MNKFHKIRKNRQFRRQQEAHRLAQGRLTAVEAAEKLGGDAVIPLANVQPGKGKPVTVGMDGQPFGGHLLVVAPPDSGWADQLTRTLWQWPDAVLVVDPGGKQYVRSAHFRQRFFGPVYAIPGYKINLAYHYPIWNEGQARKLHSYLMPPFAAEERWLIDRTLALFTAVGHYGYARKRNLIHLLFNVATCDLLRALTGLEAVPYARLHARQFTKGQSPQEAIRDPDVVYAFSLFTRQLQRYQEAYATFDTQPEKEVIPLNWVQKRGALYLTHNLTRLEEIGGLVAAIVAGLVRHHLTHGQYKKLLLVLPGLVASRIPHFPALLRMVGEYGVTVMLLTSSVDALRSIANTNTVDTLLGQFVHQLWYPPREAETAQYMAQLYGTRLQMDSSEPKWALTAAEIQSWPEKQLLVYSRRERPYRFIGQRLALPPEIHLFRAPPIPPTTAPAPRHCLAWLPALPAPQPVTQKVKVLPAPVQILLPEKSRKQAKRRVKRQRKKGLK